MRTVCQVVIFVAVVVLASILWTPPTNAQVNTCEFTPFGLECYYTYNGWCDANGCWTIHNVSFKGKTSEEWLYIWAARQGYSVCWHLHYSNPGLGWTRTYGVACNPQTLG